jgi:hypothetical protein
MLKETVIAKLRLTLSLEEPTYIWLNQIPEDIRPRSDIILSEYRDIWNEIFFYGVDHDVKVFFAQLGLADDLLPSVRIYESYQGSWIIEGSLAMSGGIGNVYSAINSVGNIEQVADGLTELKEGITAHIHSQVNKATYGQLEQIDTSNFDIFSSYESCLDVLLSRSQQNNNAYEQVLVQELRLRENIEACRMYGDNYERKTERFEVLNQLNRLSLVIANKPFNELVPRRINTSPPHNSDPFLPPPRPLPPINPVRVDFVIDARPLKAISPATSKNYKVHLSVGISRETFTLENLGDEPMQNIRIGIFKSFSQRNQWSYADSFSGQIDILSGHQTIVRDIDTFVDQSGRGLSLNDAREIYVDCWIQDNHGIYLFMFFLERS